MNTQSINKNFLRDQTFWDVDFGSLDVDNDKSFIISRVVQRGSDNEILYINSLLGYNEIYQVLINYKGVPKKVIAYYKTMKDASSR